MADTPPLLLVVGLGNPGNGYAETRHNVGFWFVDRLAESGDARFRSESRFHGEIAELTVDGERLRLLKPATFMNLSGQAVAAMARFYRVPAESILVVHDDLDLPAGEVRVKVGGGHGGHNGLRDIVSRLGSRDFVRLRFGIGHPGHREGVTGHVLSRPAADERAAMHDALDSALAELPQFVRGDWQAAMLHLHGRKVR
ncbi:MAG: aminoacyl-tRNA hydrolase [Gammaproteobacteria bacterium]|nr:MAG: aminoacyl-tRNA hydrolase [Gammaproteobacteria bacterium]